MSTHSPHSNTKSLYGRRDVGDGQLRRVVMRIASFNVENLSQRARALTAATWAEGWAERIRLRANRAACWMLGVRRSACPALAVFAFLGGIPTAAAITVDPTDRQSVKDAFAVAIADGEKVPIGWTGSIADCTAGLESPASMVATIEAVNFFRQMNRLTPVALDPVVSANALAAALMMTAAGQLSHFPGTMWPCYTAAGALGARRSNLTLDSGARAISGYIEDSGSTNTSLGHRRWVLFPPAQTFGTGSTDGGNALWVLGAPGPRPTTDVVAWPPAGQIPWSLVFDRWSVASNLDPRADYSGANVSVAADGVALPVTKLQPAVGYGDNTLAFEVDIPPVLRTRDTTFAVTIAGIVPSVVGAATSLNLSTTAFLYEAPEAPAIVRWSGSGATRGVTWTVVVGAGGRWTVRFRLAARVRVSGSLVRWKAGRRVWVRMRTIPPKTMAAGARTIALGRVTQGRYRVLLRVAVSGRRATTLGIGFTVP